jgi:hypothetical protein
VSQATAQFRERSPAQRLWIFTLIAGLLCVVAAAERDIQGRSDEEVRGSKSLWRLLSLNAVGAAAYFRWGRVGIQPVGSVP